MRKNLFMLFLFLLALKPANAQVESLEYAELEQLIGQKDDSVVVVNFWATWCKPCLQELPYFSATEDSLKNEKVLFVYVSLDFAGSAPRVKQMAEKYSLDGAVIILKGDPNQWINKVDPQWQGNIPFTIVYSGVSRESTDKPFHSVSELLEFIKNI